MMRLESLDMAPNTWEKVFMNEPSQPAITSSKLTIETLEQDVKFVQN